MKQRGFTMIELMVCMIIIGLLAGMVALSLRGMGERAKWEDVVDQVKQIDQQVRMHAVLNDVCGQMRFDLRHVRSEIWYVPADDSDMREVHKQTQMRAWRVASPFRISEVRVAGGEGAQSQIALPISSNGITLTYALKIDGQASSDASVSQSASETWLVFIGATGQVYQTEEREEVDAILLASRL